MMRGVLVLCLVALGGASDTGSCAVDGAKSMNNLANAAVDIWAASKRCTVKGEETACEVDIASAIESVNELVLSIVGAVNDCSAVKTAHYKCGKAVGELTAASAGLAAAVGGVVTHCPNAVGQTHHGVGLGKATNFGKCLMDAKGSMAGLFGASNKLAHIRGCEGESCTHDALHVVSALADLGSVLAASVDDCSAVKHGTGSEEAACASHSLELVSALHHMAAAGNTIAGACEVTKEERLYLENFEKAPTTGSSMPLALAALLPISAVLSFVAGRRFGRSGGSQVRDTEAQQLMVEE